MAKTIEDRVILRNLTGKTNFVVTIVGAFFSLFFIYTGGFGQINLETHRGIFLLCSLFLSFLFYPPKRGLISNQPRLIDWVLSFTAIISVGYWMFVFAEYSNRAGKPFLSDIIMGGITLVLVIEASRRVLGYVLPILAIIFIMYAYFGPYIPGTLAHYGVSLSRIIEYNTAGMWGVYGLVINVAASYIFPFIIFAAFIQKAGVGSAVEHIALALAGGRTGGPAKVAVFASAIIGSITGSSGANVVATGSYTIPLMKNCGYKPEQAAAIEGAASSGGQFMPPIMGASAFLIAEFTETPYIEIIKVAAIPALLYFLGVGMMVHFIAARTGLKGLPSDRLPKIKDAILQEGYLLFPIVSVLIILLMGYSPNYAAFISILLTVVISAPRKKTRMGPQKILEALVLGARNSLLIGATVGVIGLIVGIVTQTGLGVKFSSFVISLSGGYLPFCIGLIAIAAYIIGMGVSITATYILVSVIAAPALVELGVPLVTSHLAIFWYCDLGGLTPPVCMLMYAASAIAGCHPISAAYTAIRVASPMLFMPFLFIYTPILLDGPPLKVAQAIITIAVGTITFAGMMQGYWFTIANIFERILLGLATFLFFYPELYTDIIASGVLILVTILNRRRKYLQAVPPDNLQLIKGL